MLKKLTSKNINNRARPRLSKVMEKAITCWLLDGEIAKSKKDDQEQLTVLAEYTGQLYSWYELIVDSPAIVGESEYFRSMRLTQKALDSFGELLTEKAPKRKESTGRPRKYGWQAKLQALKLQKEGNSIRKIAEIMGASTFTVQRSEENEGTNICFR